MPRVTPLVFFSSTREDLRDYRGALQHIVLGLDILYRGMEFFGSRPQTPRDVMLDELVQCDLYVGIIAQKYGSIDEATGYSYTELEYNTAYKNFIPTMIFMMDNNHPVAESDREASETGREKLKQFKGSLRSAHHLEQFTTPEDLSAKVALSLERWLVKHDPEWRRMLHTPLNEFEYEYVRNLHGRNPIDVKSAVNKLRTSSNPIVQEHLYAVLHRNDLLDKDLFRHIVLQLIDSRDERRVVQMLRALAEDVPSRKEDALVALGHRSLIETKKITKEEVLFVLKYERDPDPIIRVEVAHALGKYLSKPHPESDLCLEAVTRLLNDPDAGVSGKARQVLERIPHSGVRRAAP